MASNAPAQPKPTRVSLSYEEISKLFSLPIAEAASILGVCTSVLKRICRSHGIVRWPYRKLVSGKAGDDSKNSEREKAKELLELSKAAKQKPFSSSAQSAFLSRIQAGREKIDHLMDSFQAEIVVCLQGVQAAIELSISYAVIETDALMVQQAATSEAFDLSAIGGLIKELKELCRLNFSMFSFNYQPRDCNKAPHALAALGCKCSEEDHPLVEVLPACIRSDSC